MPEQAASAALARGAPLDQASGLRKIFDQPSLRWRLVLLPTARSAMHAQALADRARGLAAHFGSTLLVDAARSQVALPLGLRLRYDLQHVLTGDCEVADACVAATQSLWVLPAARALDLAGGDEPHAAQVADAIQSIAAEMRQTILILPAGRVSWVRHLPQSARPRQALIPVLHNADASAAVLTAVRLAVSEAEIDTFRLLFLGMGEAAAGRLLSAMAAIAQRHFGATLLAAEPVPEVGPGSSRGRSRHRSVENEF
ncbi:MAG TPA: hypothetical protein VEI05_03030 [Burkholderiaceae bacterium]|nr:hypothetical protein [Burkholderiaceae bacterium]